MPRCLHCGNTEAFASSSVPPASPSAGRYPSGLVANFSSDGSLLNLENKNTSWDQVQSAWQRPEHYFDQCYHCGSRQLIWP